MSVTSSYFIPLKIHNLISIIIYICITFFITLCMYLGLCILFFNFFTKIYSYIKNHEE